jgi:hypothetical protein
MNSLPPLLQAALGKEVAMKVFIDFCRDLLSSSSPWLVIAALLAWIAYTRSVNISIKIGNRGKR